MNNIYAILGGLVGVGLSILFLGRNLKYWKDLILEYIKDEPIYMRFQLFTLKKEDDFQELLGEYWDFVDLIFMALVCFILGIGLPIFCYFLFGSLGAGSLLLLVGIGIPFVAYFGLKGIRFTNRLKKQAKAISTHAHSHSEDGSVNKAEIEEPKF